MNDIDILKQSIKEKGITVPGDQGKINEEFLKLLFKEFNIRKISESNDPSPDFEVIINGSKFILEAKLLEDIYIDPFELFYDILKELGKESFLEEYNITFEPLEIHREDVDILKTQLKNKIKLGVQGDKNFVIKGKIRTHSIKFEKKEIVLKGLTGIISGKSGNYSSNLTNVLRKRRVLEQIKNSDILFITNLNEFIKEDELIEIFYWPTGLYPYFIEENKGMTITQYSLDRTIWTKSDKLKVVLVFYPSKKLVVILPRIEETKEFNVTHYTPLRYLLEKKGFNVVFAIHSTMIQYRNGEKNDQ